MPYFQAHWNNAKKQVYSEEYDSILKSLKRWKGEDVDVVYSITYPYNIQTIGGNVKKCVFYTSEFSKLDSKYFMLGNGKSCEGMGEDFITTHVNNSENNLWFTSPSQWSSEGMREYGVPDSRNRVITHGVDTTTFKRDRTNRSKVRAFYKVDDSETLILNVGAMTQNKGIMLLLESLNVIVNRMGDKSFKLLLKGTGDLYQSKSFLELYFEDFQRRGVMSKSEVDTLLQNHIIFTDKTLSYAKINDLYNACDVYVCPYLAEGFGLVPLECLSSGCKVIVPTTGSTMGYINDIYLHGGKDFITYVTSEVHTFQGGLKQNVIDVRELTRVIVEHKENYKSDNLDAYKEMQRYIESEYSWNKVSKLLYDYLKTIVSTNVKDYQGN